MKIDLYTLCWNEMDILPFVVDYWKRLLITKAVVYDNGSTDGSVEYLKQFDWIEVRHFETNGKNNTIQRDLKNTIWKQSKDKADFVIVCDIDECLYIKDNKVFEKMKEEGYTTCAPKWYDFISEKIPVYTEGKLLHEISPKAYKGSGKVIILDPNKISDSGFDVGSHHCNAKGIVKKYEGDDVYVLHINHHLSLDYLIEKYKIFNERLSDEDKRKKHGIHYSLSEGQLRNNYADGLNKAIDFNELVNK